MSEPLRLPTAFRIGVAIALLLVLNQVAPGIPQAVLVLVGLYLLLKHSGRIATILADAVDDFDRTLAPSSPGSAGKKRA